ncbi:MAG: hypothetical protein D6751_03155 [Deltaproteobacteria bacterium]|nr:MAG: hypothetical protein D6751_03155 [Deltaproteobacteria bacterium]
MKSFALQWPGNVTDIVILSLYDVTDMVGVENYSDLEYQQLQLNLGGTYHFSPALYLTASAEYAVFVDDEPYVYGDQDGDMIGGYVGLGYRF